MAIIGVVVTFFTTTPIDYVLMAVTAICIALNYAGKNLISLLHSDSPAGSLSIINVFSGLLIALGAGILEAVGTFIVAGQILWPIVLKVVAYTTGTYLVTTFFAPPYSTEKKRVFASKRYISKLVKAAAIFILFSFPLIASAQGPWDGFLKPKGHTMSIRAEGDQSAQWFFRPSATLTAVQFNFDKELKTFKSSTFSSAGIGLGYQHYVEHSGTLVNNYGFNALVMLDASEEDSGFAAAVTINALQFVNIGGGYNFTVKQFFILTGAVYNF